MAIFVLISMFSNALLCTYSKVSKLASLSTNDEPCVLLNQRLIMPEANYAIPDNELLLRQIAKCFCYQLRR